MPTIAEKHRAIQAPLTLRPIIRAAPLALAGECNRIRMAHIAPPRNVTRRHTTRRDASPLRSTHLNATFFIHHAVLPAIATENNRSCMAHNATLRSLPLRCASRHVAALGSAYRGEN